MNQYEYEKNQLIDKISKAGDRYGHLLIECMDMFKCMNTQELTVEMLKKFIKERGIK